MIFTVEKPMTWKGLSYPLKTAQLKAAIEESGIDCNVDLTYWTPQRNAEGIDTVLTCEYWLANRHVSYNRFYIRVGTVKSENRKQVELALLAQAIPELIKFILKKVSQPANSTDLEKKSYFQAVFDGEQVRISS